MRTKLRYWRTVSNLSMRDLHEISGLTVATINSIEHGHHNPTTQSLNKLVKALNIQPQQLFTTDDDPEADGSHLQNRVA